MKKKSRSKSTWVHRPTVEEVRAKLLLTYREAAVLLGVSERTVWGLVKSGEVPHLKMGTSVRIVRTQLEAWAIAKTVTTETAATTPGDSSEADDDTAKGAA